MNFSKEWSAQLYAENPLHTDPAFLESLRQGKADAWQRMQELYAPQLKQHLHRWFPTHSAEDVEDLVQDVFVVVIRDFQTKFVYQKPGSFRGWLNSLARHQANDLRKRKEVRGSKSHAAEPAELPDPFNGPQEFEQEEHGRFIEKTILVMVREASPQRFGIFVDQVYHDLSYEELARKHGLTPSAVGNELSRMKSTLRDLLARYADARHL